MIARAVPAVRADYEAEALESLATCIEALDQPAVAELFLPHAQSGFYADGQVQGCRPNRR